MKVLIGMEYSGVVRDAFIAAGHEAMSCDLLPTDSPGPHYQGDVLDLIESQDWDLIGLHPTCTAMCVSGNRTYGRGKPKHQERLDAMEWTFKLWNLAIKSSDKVYMENPISVLSSRMRPLKAQVIQPFKFGHPEQKGTCLWLHGLPRLQETKDVFDEMMALPKNQRERIHYMPPSEDRGKLRSRTFEGIGKAMAEQWGKIS